MAIEKSRSKDLLQNIDFLFDELTGHLRLPEQSIRWVKEKILGDALAELRRLVDESRPPAFYLLGRSGHGKSSLINALANQDVAPVGHTGSPCSLESKAYSVRFPRHFSEWTVYDSRGIFEIKPPPGASAADPVKVVTEDILRYKPDIIFHVIAIPEVRACAKDVEVMSGIQAQGERIPASKNSLTGGRRLPESQRPGQRAGVCRQCSASAGGA